MRKYIFVFDFQNTTYYEALTALWGSHNPTRSAMPSISRLQKLIEAAWAQGFDLQVIKIVQQYQYNILAEKNPVAFLGI